MVNIKKSWGANTQTEVKHFRLMSSVNSFNQRKWNVDNQISIIAAHFWALKIRFLISTLKKLIWSKKQIKLITWFIECAIKINPN